MGRRGASAAARWVLAYPPASRGADFSGFPLTNGTPEFITQVFETSVGSLEFDSASFASFQATGGVPESSTWAMMLLGFAGLGFAGYHKAREPRAAT
jgi:hypothetical protein